jgi:O-methyltransferase
MLASLAVRTRRLLQLFRRPDEGRLALPFWCPLMARRHRAIFRRVRPYTMTSFERVAALCQAVAHLEAEGVAGAVVECGVWKGGSMMAAALALLQLRSTCRQLYLFDTYAGMPPPRPVDRDRDGRSAADWLRDESPAADVVRARCGLDAVRQAMFRTRYPWGKILFVAGRVEETLPARAPGRIALLRLDTDWYESTSHELEHLWPRLADGGVLIVDDYGHWQGARRAVDEYFARHGVDTLLHVIDYTGRLVVKRTPQAAG